ncbi:MAG: ROK family protein [Alphaproteobacteria bacterium]|nr:ROK family protein [Alphaproteobacteria bacterium]
MERIPSVRIGIDLGGTKTEAIAIGRDGAVLVRRRVPTAVGDYAGTVRTVADLVAGITAELENMAPAPTVGIGIPGTISPATGLVKNANSTWLIGRPLDRDLAAALGQPVRIANDADCFALSEASDGAAAGDPVVFGVILGTGVGGGVVAHGRLLAGPNAIAGEWGHNPLPRCRDDERPGPECYCGKHGCIETFLSGPGLSRDHGCGLKPADIVTAAAAGDKAAEASLCRYEERLARALATVINIIDPHTIVLGGGLSNLTRLYESLPRRIPSFVFSDQVVTAIRPPRHGDSSGVRGAAWLWP